MSHSPEATQFDRVPPQQLQVTADDIFLAADTSGDGTLTRSEMKRYLNQHSDLKAEILAGGGYVALWEALDASNGTISQEEWRLFYCKRIAKPEQLGGEAAAVAATLEEAEAEEATRQSAGLFEHSAEVNDLRALLQAERDTNAQLVVANRTVREVSTSDLDQVRVKHATQLGELQKLLDREQTAKVQLQERLRKATRKGIEEVEEAR